MTPVEFRFWTKVDMDGPVPDYRPDLGGCWLWIAGKTQGYGSITRPDQTKVRSHRWAYEKLVGPIPDGLELDHLCRVRSCVNPTHLEPVTHAENLARMPRSAITMKREQTHCTNGHPLTRGHGQRRCIICKRETGRKASRRYRMKKRREREA